jgi:hypothetical protein
MLTSGLNRLEVRESNGLYLYVVTINGVPKWNGKIAVTVE